MMVKPVNAQAKRAEHIKVANNTGTKYKKVSGLLAPPVKNNSSVSDQVSNTKPTGMLTAGWAEALFCQIHIKVLPIAKVAMACAIKTWGRGTLANQHTAHRLMAKNVNSQRMCMFNCARRSSSNNKLLIMI